MTNHTYSHNPLHFKTLSQFKNLNDFNNHYEMFLADHKREFTKRELNFLNVYRKYAAKVPGIVTAKIKTVVAAAINEYKLKTSERSAQRALAKARKLGIITLHTTSASKTGLRGPNIAQFNKYQNGGTVTANDTAKKQQSTPDTSSRSKNSSVDTKAIQNGGTLNGLTKALKIKLLYTSASARKTFKSINGKLSVKNNEPITKPVIATANPLKFVSRLKAVVYRSLLNTKKNATEIVSMVYAKVNHLTKPAPMRKHRKSLLERSLRIVDACLTAYKNGQLANIKSMRSFISSRLENEMQAFMSLQIESASKELAEPAVNIKQVYSDALRGPFYDWT